MGDNFGLPKWSKRIIDEDHCICGVWSFKFQYGRDYTAPRVWVKFRYELGSRAEASYSSKANGGDIRLDLWIRKSMITVHWFPIKKFIQKRLGSISGSFGVNRSQLILAWWEGQWTFEWHSQLRISVKRNAFHYWPRNWNKNKKKQETNLICQMKWKHLCQVNRFNGLHTNKKTNCTSCI